MRRLATALTLTVTAVLAGPALAQAAPGDLDGTFSRDGLVSAPEDGAFSDVAVSPDGTVVATTGVAVRRYLPSGDEDPGFGILGAVEVEAGGRVDLRAGGNIVVAGTRSGDFQLAELGPNGTAACGAGALCTTTDFDGRDDRIYDLFAEPSGGTLAAGVSLAPFPAGNRLAVARYLPSGALDTSFAEDGKLLFDTGGTSTFAEGAAVAGLPDGSVLLAGAGPGPDGSGAGDALLAKLQPNGALDTSFGGGDGFLTIDLAVRDDVDSIDLGPGGSILLGIQPCAFGLHTSCRAAVAKVTPSGELDSSFGAGGIVDDTAGTAVAARPDGGVFAAGGTPLRRYFQGNFSLASYGPGGGPDPGFGGGDGLATADFDLTQDFAFAVEPTTSGSVVLGGSAGGSPGLARFELAEGPPDMDADGKLDDADRCPERYAKNETGCRRVKRELKLKRAGGGRLKAKLRSEPDLCERGQPLKVMRLRPGPDRRVARPRTRRSGTWRSGELAPGRYRAKAKVKITAKIARCAGGRTKAVRVG